MRLENCTDFSNKLLKDIAKFSCNQLGITTRDVSTMYCLARSSWGGRAYYPSNRVVINVANDWPFHLPASFPCKFMGGMVANDPLEALTYLIGHELAHIAQFKLGWKRGESVPS